MLTWVFPSLVRLNIAFRGLIAAIFLIFILSNLTSQSASAAGAFGMALQFYGGGVNAPDADRVKIRVNNPATPIDVGATDFTIEWWMKTNSGDNRSTTNCSTSNDSWINGNIIIDRDIYNAGDYGDFGISLMNNRLAFGVNNGSSGTTICGTRNIADSQWHHIAIQRRRSDGYLWLYVDGSLDASVNGPDGDISYRDNRSTSFPNSDPFLVIAAEKHDAGSAYPSYRGLVDELRISTTLRYTSTFTRPSQPFSPDGQTVGLYHFNEGSGTTVYDSSTVSGGPTNGTFKVGGSPAGPVYSTDTPNGNPSAPTPTSSPTPQPTSTPNPTNTPVPTNVPTSTPMPPTPAPGGQYGLRFDGGDYANGGSYTGATGTQTIEMWIQPSTNNQSSIVVINGMMSVGWSLELDNGAPIFWVDNGGGWLNTRHQTALVANRWYHLAVTYQSGNARIFVDGVPNQSKYVGNISSGPGLWVGGLAGQTLFRGTLDELRISRVVRYTNTFTRPSSAFSLDNDTLVLYHFNEGTGQYVNGDANRGPRLTLGGSTSEQSSDPVWTAGL